LVADDMQGPTSDGIPLGALQAVLQRNEREIRAAGLAAWLTALPSALEMPELCLLTVREYEIVLRLAAGRRVAAIAKELFVSPSTVRNHLTTIYRKFGVRSQVELLDRLRTGSKPTA
jgi:DNA-binding CsgD family transcriptional regulator